MLDQKRNKKNIIFNRAPEEQANHEQRKQRKEFALNALKTNTSLSKIIRRFCLKKCCRGMKTMKDSSIVHVFWRADPLGRKSKILFALPLSQRKQN